MSLQEGFLFEELSEYMKKFLLDLKNKFPEKAEEFLKIEAKKCLKTARKVAKKEIGTSKGKKKDWNEKKSYYKGFKVGKPYKYLNDMCRRVYNKAAHAHLIEYGHMNIPRGTKRSTTRAGREKQKQERAQRQNTFTPGKFVFKLAEMQFFEQFYLDADKFMIDYFNEKLKK